MKKNFKNIITIICIVITGLGVGMVQYSDMFYYLDNYIMDHVKYNTGNIDPRIKIIGIDDKTLEEYGTFGTWDRSIYGELVNALIIEGNEPKIIGFDILFPESMSEKGDKEFAVACEKAENVVVAMNVNIKTAIIEDEETGKSYLDDFYVEEVYYPYKGLKDEVSYGCAEVIPDKDGYIRNDLWEIKYGEEQLPSFANTVYQNYYNTIGKEVVVPKVDDYYKFGFTYSTTIGEYDYFSMIDVIEGNINPAIFKDSIVLIGAYTKGLQDNYNVPVERGGFQMYGVEVQANIVQALMEEETTQEVSELLLAIIVGLGTCIYIFILWKMKVRGAVVLVIISLIAYVASAYVLFQIGYTANFIVFPISIILFTLISIVVNYFIEYLKQRELMRTFKRYVSPQVVDTVMKKTSEEYKTTGERKKIVVLFSDIRGFTELTERLEPEEVINILNRFLGISTEKIYKYEGSVDKFIGDAIMAVFNAPFDVEDYEFKAICAATEILNASKDINREMIEKYDWEFVCGMGLDYGEAITGNVGSDFRMDYTSIGNTVNTASRIEGFSQNGELLVSEDLYNKVKERVNAKFYKEVEPKGKKEKVKLYEILGIYND